MSLKWLESKKINKKAKMIEIVMISRVVIVKIMKMKLSR